MDPFSRPKRLNTIKVRIDGSSIMCQWISAETERGMPVWVANWLDDITHQAIYDANPCTLIQIERS